MTFSTTRHMTAGGADYRQRLTLTFVPGRERRYKEIYCLCCSRKLFETYDDLAYLSDVADVSNLIPSQPGGFGFKCPGGCRTWYEVKGLPGIFNVELTKLFFLDTEKKRREVHCLLCKEPFVIVLTGMVYSYRNASQRLVSDENGFVPTFCPGRGCSQEYEIATHGL